MPRGPFVLILSVLVFGAAGCAGFSTEGPATPSASVSAADAAMRTVPAGARPPSAVGVPPMPETALHTAAQMLARTPESSIPPLSWTQIPGGAQSGAAAPDGSLWVVANDFCCSGGSSIWHYVNGTWTEIQGAATRLTVAPDGSLWALTLQGAIYHYVNGTWSTMVGGASDISIGSDGSVYIVANAPCCVGGNSIWHYTNGNWTELAGAGVRIAASWDPSSYPGVTTPGGFYVTTAQATIYYYNGPLLGYALLPGAALQLAPTNSGGLLALGNDAAAQKSIWYYDLSAGNWTQEPGLGANITVGGANVYIIAANGSIYMATSNYGALTANPTALNFLATGAANAQSVVVSQGPYSGPFTTASANCGGIATVAPATTPNTFSVTPVGAGSCNLTLSGAQGKSATIAITVTVTIGGGA